MMGWKEEDAGPTELGEINRDRVLQRCRSDRSYRRAAVRPIPGFKVGRWDAGALEEAGQPRTCSADVFVVGAEQKAWQGAGMSTPAPTDPNALRPLLHERLDQWAADDLPLQTRLPASSLHMPRLAPIAKR